MVKTNPTTIIFFIDIFSVTKSASSQYYFNKTTKSFYLMKKIGWQSVTITFSPL